MKCGVFIKHKPNTPSGRARVPDRVSWWDTTDLGLTYATDARSSVDLLNDGYQRCDGNIVVTVQIVDEPYFGGSSSELKVEYKCDKCGWNFYPEIERQDIGTLLTQHLKTIDEVPLQMDCKQSQIEYHERIGLAIKQSEERWREREAVHVAKRGKKKVRGVP